MRKILFFFVLIIVPCFSVPNVFLQITKNFSQKADVVLLYQLEKNNYWKSFSDVFRRDLYYSGYFNVEAQKFVKDIEKSKNEFPVNIIISLRREREGIKVDVFDNLEEKVLFKKNYKLLKNSRYFAHTVNDDIIFALTGKPGIARSKILFVSDRTGKYQVYISDYDGENLKQVTNFNYLVNFPVWAPDRKSFYFVSYKNGWPEIDKYNISTGKEETVFEYPGLNACVTTCKSKNVLGVVLSKSGNPEIYLTTSDGKIIRKLTNHRGIDSSPSFSPDGKKIAFVSDRYGNPQIFIMDKDGFGVKRISYISGYATCPRWSPDGKYIAYVVLKNGFKIAVYDIETRKTKLFENSKGAEAISWAPDSRHIVFSKTDIHPSRLCVIDVFTGETRYLTGKEYNAFSPDWEKF